MPKGILLSKLREQDLSNIRGATIRYYFKDNQRGVTIDGTQVPVHSFVWTKEGVLCNLPVMRPYDEKRMYKICSRIVSGRRCWQLVQMNKKRELISSFDIYAPLLINVSYENES